jgi:hypothetical protein
MAIRYNELRGAIYSRYRSQKDFCDALGWKKQKLQKLLSGKISLKRDDIIKLKRILEIPDDRVCSVFLTDN